MDLSSIKEIFLLIPQKILNLLENMLSEKRRVFFVAIGALFTFLLVIILISVNTSSGQGDGRGGVNAAERLVTISIPHDELFFPDEPDFVPDFLLEREPRLIWTMEDIRPYWRVPGNYDFWRNELRSEVDLLMDGVP